MTKINETNLPGMTTQQNLTVDDIFNENLIIKSKQVNYTAIEEAKSTNKSPITKVIVDQTLKRKPKFDHNTNYDTGKPMQPNINITIDKDCNKTIRLELRHPDNQCVITDYKINEPLNENGEELTLENEDVNGYAMKTNLSLDNEAGNEDMSAQNEEFVNENEGDDKVSTRELNIQKYCRYTLFLHLLALSIGNPFHS